MLAMSNVDVKVEQKCTHQSASGDCKPDRFIDDRVPRSAEIQIGEQDGIRQAGPVANFLCSEFISATPIPCSSDQSLGAPN